MRFEAVIFDMDGTLLDTLKEIADAMNAALATLGYPPHHYDAYREYVGFGMDVLARRVLPEGHKDDAVVVRLVEAMRVIYGRDHAFLSRPYDGIPELLDALVDKGVAMTILSNKPDEFTRAMAERLLGRWRFEIVRGIIPGRPRKPEPDAAQEMARSLNLSPQKIVFMGDSAIDMLTARAAGMFPVGVLWGFRTRDELVENGAGLLIDHPRKLLDLFTDQNHLG
ncbi:MAG: HAD family hydrolase [Syntrophaceae bacterium]